MIKMTNKDKINSISKKEWKSLIAKSRSLRGLIKNIGLPNTGPVFYSIKSRLSELKINYEFRNPLMIYNRNVFSNIFKNINTKEKAYWLGFIAADGYVPLKKDQITIELSIKDECLINEFISFINGSFDAKRKRIGVYNSESISFTVCNKVMSNDVKKIGIISPKSKKNLLINFGNKKINMAYLMGYYDGDGSARSPIISSGSKSFLLSIKKEYSLKGKIKFVKNKYGSCYYLYIGINFLRNLLLNYPKSLKRKRLLLNNFYRNKNNCKCGNKKEKRAAVCKYCYINK